MSHVVSCELEIKDLELFKKACELCGLEFKRGQKTYKWYGKWMNDYNEDNAAYLKGIATSDYGKCEHAASVIGEPHAYEVGLIKSKNGNGYKIIYDFWGSNGKILEEKIGKNACKLKEEYTKLVLKKVAAQKGYNYTEMTVNNKVEIKLIKK